MAEQSDKTASPEHQHAPRPAPAPLTTPAGQEHPHPESWTRLLRQASASAGAPDPAGTGTSTVLQRQQARLLGDPRLSKPLYAQRRAELFLQLQRTYGNTYARQVVQLMQAQPHRAAAPGQREAGPKEEAPQEVLARQAAADTTLQHSGSAAASSALDVAGEIGRSRGSGQSLDPAARAKLEGAMGVDLGNVSIHADSQADTLSRSVQAEAFTTGSDVYFRAGRYDPHSEGGLHLLAHELTHTVQQSKGAVSGTQHSSGVSVSDPGDSFEQEAEQNAAHTLARIQSNAQAEATPPGILRERAEEKEEAVQRLADRQSGQVGQDGNRREIPRFSTPVIARWPGSKKQSPEREKYNEASAALEKFKAKNYADEPVVIHPSTGQGKFRAQYFPKRNDLRISVKCRFNFQSEPKLDFSADLQKAMQEHRAPVGVKTEDRWEPEAIQEWKRKFFLAIKADWSGNFDFHCQKDWWENLSASVEVEFYEAADSEPGGADLTVIVHKGIGVGRSNVRLGGGLMEVNQGDVDGTVPGRIVVHEAGHVLGLGDEYIEPDDPKTAGTPAAHSALVKKEFGHPILRDQFNKDSIMNAGTKILPEHGVTLLEALRSITGMQEWASTSKSPRAIPPEN